MKTFSFLSILLLTFGAIGQNAPQWINCTNGFNVQDVFKTTTHLWIANTGGIVQHDLATGENVYYNRGNSPIPSNYVNSVIVDSDGLVWMTTRSGLANFDGNSWNLFYERDGRLTLDENGHAALINSDSLSIWNGQDFIDTQLPESLNFLIVSDFIIDPETGTVWMSAYTFGQYHIVKYKDQNWTTYDHNNSPLPFDSPYNNPMVLDAEGKLWIGNSNGLYQLDNNEWTYFDPQATSFPSGVVLGLARTLDDKIWAVVRHGLTIEETVLVEFINDTEFITHSLPTGLLTNGINRLRGFEDSPEVYLGTVQNSSFKFEQDTWTQITASQSPLTDNSITQIFIDDETTWIHAGRSYPYGRNSLFTIETGNWNFLDSQTLPFMLENRIPTILTKGPNNGLWIHQKDSLYRFQDGQWSTPLLPDILEGVAEANSFIHFEPNGSRWLLEKYQSYLFYESDQGWISFEHEEHGAPGGDYNRFFNHPITGHFWLASGNGISRYDGTNWTTIKPEDFGAGLNWVHEMVVNDEGTIWASSGKVLLKIEGEVITVVNNETSPLYQQQIRDLTLDSENNLWVGLIGRIAKYDGQSWLIFDKTNAGIPNGRIDNLNFDAEGNLWVGSTEGGFAVYNEAGLSDDFWLEEHPNALAQTPTDLVNSCDFFPNPIAKGVAVQLQLPEHFLIDPTSKIVCYNTSGQQVWKRNITNRDVRIPAHFFQSLSGLYYLSIQNSKGVYTCTTIVE